MARKQYESVERERKDIREHDWEATNFDVNFTDSTNPFSVINSQINDRDNEYAFILNDSSRIMSKRLEGYSFVDPSIITGYSDIFMDRDRPDRITTGDLVYMKRPINRRVAEDERIRKSSYEKVKACIPNIQNTTGRIRNIESPFSE